MTALIAAVLVLVGELKGNARKLQPLRARIRAELGDAEGALAELERLSGSTWRHTAEEVARALEAHQPEAAVRLYRALVDALLAHGTKPARLRADEIRVSGALATWRKLPGSLTCPSITPPPPVPADRSPLALRPAR